MDELLQSNQERELTKAEEKELDELLARVDQMNILKARAQYTLQQRKE